MQISFSINDFQKSLILWFQANGRFWIPWKLKSNGSCPGPGESISPYGIWIAEVMLQQTQLNVVIPYWNNWMSRFPTLIDLVEADSNEILLQWQGLGYYSRALNIHLSSELLFKEVGKDNISDPLCWPLELDQWLALPGIGRTTGGSILSSAFDKPYPILDGNVK